MAAAGEPDPSRRAISLLSNGAEAVVVISQEHPTLPRDLPVLWVQPEWGTIILDITARLADSQTCRFEPDFGELARLGVARSQNRSEHIAHDSLQ